MSIFNKIAHAFKPVGHAIEEFNPEHAAKAIEEALEEALVKPVKAKLPDHLSFGDVQEILTVAKPDYIDVDVFVGFGVEIGIEFEIKFGMGITIADPVGKIEAIENIIEHPPATVHQLCDHLWSLAPDEVRVYEELAASIGEQGMLRWSGEGVMTRVVEYITDRGWMEHRLRP